MSEKNRTVRRLLIGLALLVVASFAAPWLVPSSFIARQIAALIQEKTGRQLRIDGPISFSLVPRVALVAHDVHLSSPAGGFSNDFLSAAKIDVSLAPIALLQGAIEIEHLSLLDPAFVFEIDANGRRNWLFHPVKASPSTEPARTPTNSLPSPTFISADAMITDGTVRYIDDRSGRMLAVGNINSTVSLPQLDQPLNVAGGAIYNGEPVTINLMLDSPQSLQSRHAAQIVLRLAGPRGSFDFDGTVQNQKSLGATGSVALKTPSLRDLLNWVGVSGVSDVDWLGEASLASKLNLGERLTLANAVISLDGVEAHGNIVLTAQDKRIELAFTELSVSGGTGFGNLSVDTKSSPPAITAGGKFSAVAFNRLPVGIAGFGWVRGTGDAIFDLSASGKSAHQIVGSLNGTGSIHFTNGSVENGGLRDLLRSQAPMINSTAIPREIEYRSLSASATITQGILHNGDLQLVGPQLSATGAGTLDLVQHRIDYRWQPDIAGLGKAQLAISGDWDNPNYNVEALSITNGLAIPGLKLR